MITAVRTTGIFCIPGCPARPRPENTETFGTTGEALVAGYRPCKRCRPLDEPDLPAPAKDAPAVRLAVLDTPLGPMIAGALGRELVLLEFADRRMLGTQFRRLSRALRCAWSLEPATVLARLSKQLDEYFAGRRRTFDVPLRAGGTEFQRRVWTELGRIPPGATRSYRDMAAAIGRSAAVRAVARANGDNRIAILIPCHRVIGADGTLVGYGGGLWRKRKLLDLEAGAVSAA